MLRGTMSPLRAHFFTLSKQADIRDQAVAMMLKHEGKPGKITRDTGGTTNAGIAESGGEFTAAQIKKLSPAQVKGYWGNKWDNTGGRFPAPGAGLAYFDAQANAGPGRATRWMQEAVGVKPDGKFGSGTQQALAGADQQKVTRHLVDRLRQHHQRLVRNDPGKYGKYADGWANRRTALRNNPLVAPLLAPRPAGQVTPQANGSVKVQGAPSPGLLIDTVPAGAGSALSKKSSLRDYLRKAEKATNANPTPGQIAEGNYAKGEVVLHGLRIKIENPKGSVRRGVDGSGKKWERTMVGTYGYFKSTMAADGDAVDCFIGPDPDSHFVAAIDQMKGKTFDETKFLLGCRTKEEAEKLYLAHYPRGWTLGPVSTTTVQQLKEWLKEGDTKSPFGGQMLKAASLSAWFAARAR